MGSVVQETIHLLNEVIPKPSLDGVTPTDVHEGVAGSKVEANRQYVEQENPDVKPWKRNYRDVLKAAMAVEKMTALEVMTKFCFFCPRPLRKITKYGLEGVG